MGESLNSKKKNKKASKAEEEEEPQKSLKQSVESDSDSGYEVVSWLLLSAEWGQKHFVLLHFCI